MSIARLFQSRLSRETPDPERMQHRIGQPLGADQRDSTDYPKSAAHARAAPLQGHTHRLA